MSVLPTDHDTIPHGGPEMLRARIREAAGRAALQAQMAMDYAELGDDVGLQYALRCLVAYTRSALATLSNLNALRINEHRRAAE
jgi:hypothetical protein